MVHIFFNQQSHPIFHSEQRLVNLVRRIEWSVGLSILLVYGATVLLYNVNITVIYCYDQSEPW